MSRRGQTILNRISRLAATGSLNACPVVLKWRSPASVSSANPAIETAATPEGEDHEETVNAFVHYVGSNDTGGDTTARARFTEIQRGDVILDFPGDVDLDGKPNLRFGIGGRDYVQKAVGGPVAQSWDVRMGGVPIIRTICVQPLT